MGLKSKYFTVYTKRFNCHELIKLSAAASRGSLCWRENENARSIKENRGNTEV